MKIRSDLNSLLSVCFDMHRNMRFFRDCVLHLKQLLLLSKTQYLKGNTLFTKFTDTVYLSSAPEIKPSFWWSSCCLVFSFLCCVMCAIICLFVFFIFSHGVVSLYSIYEFDSPSVFISPLFSVILSYICRSYLLDLKILGKKWIKMLKIIIHEQSLKIGVDWRFRQF